MKRPRKGILGKMRIRCFGGCIGPTVDNVDGPDVIDMNHEDEDFLHLNDFTTCDANLLPMLPEEVEFRRVEDVHGRNLTIVDRSPIEVRKFEDLTRELVKVKEPIAVQLPLNMPFDMTDEHPSMAGEALTASDDDTRDDESALSNNGIDEDTCMDAACYRLAERIYQMEKSKIDNISHRNLGKSDLMMSREYKNLTTRTNGSTCVSSDSAGNDTEDNKRNATLFNSGGSKELKQYHISMQEAVLSDRSEYLTLENIHDLNQSRGLPSHSKTANPFDYEDFATPTTDIANKEELPQKLHHVSAYQCLPAVEFLDPFEEDGHEESWPMTFGSQVWSLIVRGYGKPSYDDSLNISMEGNISSFYSKEELRVLRKEFERLPRSEIPAIVESTINILNG